MSEKKPRVDKKKNVAKVAAILTKNPHATEREIAEATWMGNGTAHRAKEELEKSGAKDETILYIVNWAKSRLKKIDDVLNRFVDESVAKDELNRSDTSLIKDIANDDLKRITVLWWNVTDKDWWLRVRETDLLD